ncbi:MAG: DUF559 domain-containing protein [Acidimicrobiia bacterium]
MPELVTAELARHDGVAAVRTLERLGLRRRQIDGLVAAGWWERAGRGVVRDRAAPRTWRQELWAAALAVGPHAVASHESAAALHGLGGFAEGPIVLSVPRAARGRRQGMVVHGAGRLARPDVVEIDGMRVTSASRTIIDLAAIGTAAGRLADVIDDSCRLGLSSPAYVRRRLDALGRRGRAGVRLLDELMLDSGGHSHLERRFLGLVRSMGLPRPSCQVIHRRGSRTVARVDFEWTPWRTVVEVSGRRGHVSDRDRTKDAQRRNELQHEGFVVLEFTTAHILGDPEYVHTTLTSHLSAHIVG